MNTSSSTALWDAYTEHRARVMDLLLNARASDTGRLCVLGAGSCNDIELGVLADAYSEVHLVDIDAAAMEAGVRRQRACDRIERHGGVDVSGDLIAAWREGSAPSSDPLRELPAPLDQGGFDVVASTCLLSQLVRAVVTELGEDHPRLGELALALRDRHLELLVALARPGGRAILVTDIVSNDTCPELWSVSTEELPELERRLVLAHNFFTGVNPFVLRHAFAHHPRLAPRVAALRAHDRWIWSARERAFLVVALSVERARG